MHLCPPHRTQHTLTHHKLSPVKRLQLNCTLCFFSRPRASALSVNSRVTFTDHSRMWHQAFIVYTQRIPYIPNGPNTHIHTHVHTHTHAHVRYIHKCAYISTDANKTEGWQPSGGGGGGGDGGWGGSKLFTRPESETLSVWCRPHDQPVCGL